MAFSSWKAQDKDWVEAVILLLLLGLCLLLLSLSLLPDFALLLLLLSLLLQGPGNTGRALLVDFVLHKSWC